MSAPALLPLDGYVLAGGQSSRMGTDKAFLVFRGKPLVEQAVTKLRGICTTVTIAGNQAALEAYAAVVRDRWQQAGPVSGLEAGLRAAERPWALFTPVDVPLAPEPLLRDWAQAVLHREATGVRLSFLTVQGRRQPTFCMMHKACLPALTQAAALGVRKLGLVFEEIASTLGDGSVWMVPAEPFAAMSCEGTEKDLEVCFANLNTPEDLLAVS